MKKYEFLRELENSLAGKLSETDINEVLSDYGDIFDNGMSQGRSEDEIAESIGSPAAISKTIVDDSQRSSTIDVNQAVRTDTSNLASMSRRLGAYLIDTFATSLLIIALLLAAFIPYSVSTEISTSQEIITEGAGTSSASKNYIYPVESTNTAEDILDTYVYRKSLNTPFVASNIIGVLFFMLFSFGFLNIITAVELWVFRGYTLGKWITRIRVVNMDGGRITFWDAILRDVIIKSIGNAITSGILNVASFVWGCSTPEHKTVHDLAAKTKVISVVR